jgi:hypothetical protein
MQICKKRRANGSGARRIGDIERFAARGEAAEKSGSGRVATIQIVSLLTINY